MSDETRAALAYTALAFALGVLLGPLREFVLAPRIGRLSALMMELPVMLAFCWWLAPRVMRRLPPGLARLRAGLAALGFLLLLEFTLGQALRGFTLNEWAAQFGTREGALTLIGYIAFALIPWLRPAPHAGGRPS
ncbi:MAG: hypothetical protein N3D18_03465 [Roseococcus sp.]|nr:hypothetical protein [Roseococcus sp.]